ncbi:hypothetical protein MRX96_004898 [Rhipicephalus microplus]
MCSCHLYCGELDAAWLGVEGRGWDTFFRPVEKKSTDSLTARCALLRRVVSHTRRVLMARGLSRGRGMRPVETRAPPVETPAGGGDEPARRKIGSNLRSSPCLAALSSSSCASPTLALLCAHFRGPFRHSRPTSCEA